MTRYWRIDSFVRKAITISLIVHANHKLIWDACAGVIATGVAVCIMYITQPVLVVNHPIEVMAAAVTFFGIVMFVCICFRAVARHALEWRHIQWKNVDFPKMLLEDERECKYD